MAAAVGPWGRGTRAIAAVALLAGCATEPGANSDPPPGSPPAIPVTGQSVPELAGMDRAISNLITDWRIPGGAVAVTYQGRLVYARGFGYADTASKRVVEPTSLFRVADVSKPITAVAIMTLVEEGRLRLDDKAFAILSDLAGPPNTTPDPRVASITVEQLLWHSGGWDSNVSGDPFGQSRLIALALGIPGPPTARQLISYMLGRPLDFSPGSQFAFSNFGFAVAGRVIEKVTGQGYQQYLRLVLARAGIHRMEIARTRLSERHPDEVRYYDPNNSPSVFPDEGTVSAPDGAVYFESADASDGWLASVVDLARLLTAVDGAPGRPDLIGPVTLDLMLRPPPRLWDGSPYHYAQGWLVRPAFGNWWHNGSAPGTASFAARIGADLTIAAVFNARSMTPGSPFEALIESALGDGIRVSSWPTHDLFGRYP